MGKTAVVTRRRRKARQERRPLVFPAQRRAAREQAAKLAGISERLTGTSAKARRWPRPLVWLLWLGGAALASVFIGFVLGLARPRPHSEVQV